MSAGFSLIDEIVEKMTSRLSDDDRVEASLAVMGEGLGLTYIAVKEVVAEMHVLCCTYEWSANGRTELLNSESRFSDDVWERWMSGAVRSSKMTIWNADDGTPCPLKMVRKNLVGTIIHTQMYKNDIFIGAIDFVDNRPGRRFTPAEKEQMILFTDMLKDYLAKWHKNTNQYQTEVLSSVYDHTTKLPRYEFFCMEVEESFKELESSQLVILSLDFTNFKFINEKYGHDEGDIFLENVAKDIYSFTKWVISCCRSHSDNFLLVCKCDKSHSKAHIINRIEEISKEYVKKLSEKYYDCNLCVNIGIHVIRANTENIEHAISNANLARKYAKKRKHEYGHSCLTYDPAMAFELKKRAEYISDMKKGIESGEFFLEFQPIVLTDTMEIIGAEALVRWKKDNFYRLMPDDFIPIFERDGCIVKMDYYVYEQVFKIIDERMKNGKHMFPISANVSIVHFYDGKLIGFIDSLLEKYNVDPKYIYFEIDERIAVMKIDNVSNIIAELQRRGFLVYIDNFGSGYSALNTLTNFNPNGIKIGRSLMKKDLDKNDRIIMSCVINMGNKLGIEVISEGIECEEQRQFLIKSSCEYMQGNLFSGPVSIEAIDLMLDKANLE
ncbi:MAG: EAL domain-containing protein [Lachnospiraceae bacterium]|nr:EAL domain-containing protein [Lachnospiraceae bacterium]